MTSQEFRVQKITDKLIKEEASKKPPRHCPKCQHMWVRGFQQCQRCIEVRIENKA